MTLKKLLLLTLMQWLLWAVLKVLFFKYFAPMDTVLSVIYIALTGVVAVAVSRRLGVLNYLEAMFIGGFWFFLDHLLDLLITAGIAGFSMYAAWQFWAGYLTMLAGVFFFHKKRHVEIRKEQAAHHGHGHH